MQRFARSLPILLRNRPLFQYKFTGHRPATTLATPVTDPVESAQCGASFSNPIRLRDYQEECIQAVLAYFEGGGTRAGISLATGSGKTVIFTQLIDRVKAPTPTATQTLILAHRRELVEQAARHCENAYPSKTVEIEMGNTKSSGNADITVASVSSIISNDRIEKFDPTRFKLVLVDEAHHIAAASYMQTLRYFGLLRDSFPVAIDQEPPSAYSSDLSSTPALVGVSATFSRFDGIRLSDAIDHIVYHKDYVDMIGDKWLSEVIFTTVESKANLSAVKHTRFQDFQIGDLSKAVNNQTSNEVTVRAWISKAAERKSTLGFCVDLAHVTDLTSTFRRHGIDARFITSDTPKSIRGERLESFRKGDFPVLLNCGVFTEGTDIPNIDCVLLARPTKSRNLLVQMIGRGMRLHAGKTNCHVIDMVASLQAGVITTPTLFGLDPNAMVNEASVKELKKEHERKELEAEREAQVSSQTFDTPPSAAPELPRNITFTEYASVHDLIGDTSGETHIRRISKLAWVRVKEDRYILSSQNGDYIAIDAAENCNGYVVNYLQKILEIMPMAERKSKSPYMRPRQIAQAGTLEDAVHAGDTFATQKFPWRYIHHGQTWRKAPASESQLAFINKIRPMQDQLTAEMVTKGKAGDMISKIKFGAKGWFNQMAGERKRKLKQADSLSAREEVKVGALFAERQASHPQFRAAAPALTLGQALAGR